MDRVRNEDVRRRAGIIEMLASRAHQRVLKVKKVKSSMARSLPMENLLPQNVGSFINNVQ